MIDKDSFFAEKIFALSIYGRDTTTNNNSNIPIQRGKDIIDYTWPFMCVSVLFTKEALQTLRSGVLNKYCNQRKSIFSVLTDFHHASFLEFGK